MHQIVSRKPPRHFCFLMCNFGNKLQIGDFCTRKRTECAVNKTLLQFQSPLNILEDLKVCFLSDLLNEIHLTINFQHIYIVPQ